MSLKSKIQEMIYIIKFYKLYHPSTEYGSSTTAALSFRLSTTRYDISDVYIPSFFRNISSFFYGMRSNKTITYHHNGTVEALIYTFFDNDGTINLDFDTKNVVNFIGAFGGKGRGSGVSVINGVLDMTGVPKDNPNFEPIKPDSHKGFDAFINNQYIAEVRFKENSIPYYCWDMDFSATEVLSEESLLSIANGIQKSPDEIIDDETAMIFFSSTTMENMPQYIKDIFAEKRCFLG